jgi:stringent starvation protein B
MAETSTKPYMIRALYEWCCDNGYTPYLAVSVDEHTLVPRQHVKGGEIVLNVSPMATSRLSLGNELVEFQARFSGVAQQISIPVGNVSAIYARETGQGMAFEIVQAPAAEDEDGEGAAEGTGSRGHDAHGDDGSGPATAGDEAGRHGHGSTVQALRGGARRRGPRRVELEGSDGLADDHSGGSSAGNGSGGLSGTGSEADLGAAESRADAVHENGSGRESDSNSNEGRRGGGAESGGEEGHAEAANSRRRAAKGQGSADVLAFAPAAGATKKRKGNVAAGVKQDHGDGDVPTLVDAADDDEDPPPAESGGKGGKARLTRVK